MNFRVIVRELRHERKKKRLKGKKEKREEEEKERLQNKGAALLRKASTEKWK